MPKGVKKRKSKFRPNVTKRADYQKKIQKRKKKSHSSEKSVKVAWDEHKTARENLSSMHLAFDPNEAVRIKKYRRLIIDTVPIEGMPTPEPMQVENPSVHPKKYKKKLNPKAADVLPVLSDKAAQAEQKVQEEKATSMARDSRNLFQHTPKQIKKIINIYKDSPMYKAING